MVKCFVSRDGRILWLYLYYKYISSHPHKHIISFCWIHVRRLVNLLLWKRRFSCLMLVVQPDSACVCIHYVKLCYMLFWFTNFPPHVTPLFELLAFCSFRFIPISMHPVFIWPIFVLRHFCLSPISCFFPILFIHSLRLIQFSFFDVLVYLRFRFTQFSFNRVFILSRFSLSHFRLTLFSYYTIFISPRFRFTPFSLNSVFVLARFYLTTFSLYPVFVEYRFRLSPFSTDPIFV